MEHLNRPFTPLSMLPPPVLTGVPYEKQWDILKPFLQELYVVQGKNVPQIVGIMKERYNFPATETSYKYKFKNWGWKKNISSSKKAAMCEIRQTRANMGKLTALEYGGKEVNHQKLRRFLKTSMRQESTFGGLPTIGDGTGGRALSGPALAFGNSVFLNWSIPYENMRSLRMKHRLLSGPTPSPRSTPSDVEVTTPLTSPLMRNDMPSPLSKLQNQKLAFDRAHMFVQGQHAELVKLLKTEEKKIISTWLSQFWLFGFKSAKHWGRGPRDWNVETLKFTYDIQAAPRTIPSLFDFDTMIIDSASPRLRSNSTPIERLPKPPALCRWSIHCTAEASNADYEPIDEPFEPELEPDPQDETTWQYWPDAWKSPQFQSRLVDGLASNTFSNIKAEELPIAVPHVVKTSERCREEFLPEAYGFAIMARNLELVEDLNRELSFLKIRKFTGHYPLHLAAAFLDGSKACCNIFTEVLKQYIGAPENALGHSPLDTLMITILKSHTSVTPKQADSEFKDERRFPGEEVDICGRWDADSNCFRELVATGQVRTPFEWKHKFCHTSAQAICHCIVALDCRYDFSNFSGLFSQRCFDCGLSMRLTPLHTAVMIAYHLSQSGCKEEDLFGIIAIILTMLSCGANPTLMATISPDLLFESSDQTMRELSDPKQCRHEELDPGQFAALISSKFSQVWSRSCLTGWSIICHILRISIDEWNAHNVPMKIGCHYWYNKHLAVLHCAMQTEMLTYRRQDEGDPWISNRFDMEAIEKHLAAGLDVFEEGYGGYPLKLAHCNCAGFWHVDALGRPHMREATDGDFSNLEDNMNLVTYIPAPLELC